MHKTFFWTVSQINLRCHSGRCSVIEDLNLKFGCKTTTNNYHFDIITRSGSKEILNDRVSDTNAVMNRSNRRSNDQRNIIPDNLYMYELGGLKQIVALRTPEY